MKKTCIRIAIAIITPWTSKRLWMTVIALTFLNSLFWPAVKCLYSFTQEWQLKYFFFMYSMVIGAGVTVILTYLLKISNGVGSTADSVQKLIEKKIENE